MAAANAASSDIIITVDTDQLAGETTPDFILASMAIKGSAKTNADLNGTYVMYQFMDELTGTGNFATSITEATFNGFVLNPGGGAI